MSEVGTPHFLAAKAARSAGTKSVRRTCSWASFLPIADALAPSFSRKQIEHSTEVEHLNAGPAG